MLFVAEIALNDTGAFREIVTDAAKMGGLEPRTAAEIRRLPSRRPVRAVAVRRAA